VWETEEIIILVFKDISSKASMVLLGERTIKKRGIIPTMVGGIGVDMTLRAFDRLLGSPMQKFAGINVPFIGNVGIIDVVTFLIFSAGGKNMKGGIVSVAGAKFVGGTLPSIGSIQLPGSITAGTGSSVASGTAGAPV